MLYSFLSSNQDSSVPGNVNYSFNNTPDKSNFNNGREIRKSINNSIGVVEYFIEDYNRTKQAEVKNRILRRIFDLNEKSSTHLRPQSSHNGYQVDCVRMKNGDRDQMTRDRISKLKSELSIQPDYSVGLLMRYLMNLSNSNFFYVSQLFSHFNENVLTAGPLTNELVSLTEVILLLDNYSGERGSHPGFLQTTETLYPAFSVRTRRIIASIIHLRYSHK